MASRIETPVFERIKTLVGGQRCNREVDLFSPLHCWIAVRVPHQERKQQRPPDVQVSCNRSSHTLFPKLLDLQTTLVADLIDQFSYHINTVERIASYFLDTTVVLSLHVIRHDELSTAEQTALTEAQRDSPRVCIHTAIVCLGHSGTAPDSVERAAALKTICESNGFCKVRDWLDAETRRISLFDDVPLDDH